MLLDLSLKQWRSRVKDPRIKNWVDAILEGLENALHKASAIEIFDEVS